MDFLELKQPRYIIGAIVIVLAVGGVIVLATSGGGGLTVETPDEETIGTEVITQPMPVDGNIQHPEFGKQTYFSYGAISGVEGTPANGVLYGRMFEGDTYFHTMNLNIQVPENGAFYQGWLRNEAGEYVKTERLYNRFGDVRFALEFDANRDLTGYKTVVVSRETSDDVTQPTTIVAEGTLKEAKQGN